jgi:hypothetical protein
MNKKTAKEFNKIAINRNIEITNQRLEQLKLAKAEIERLKVVHANQIELDRAAAKAKHEKILEDVLSIISLNANRGYFSTCFGRDSLTLEIVEELTNLGFVVEGRDFDVVRTVSW